jgi:arsenical pump membrane protein
VALTVGIAALVAGGWAALVGGVGAVGRAMGALAEPFAIVTAIVLVGGAVACSGPSRRALRAATAAAGSRRAACAIVLAVTAAVAAVVNLDVAVVVAMPLALTVAVAWRLDAGWLTIAVAAVANASSFLLPTSNVTNILVAGQMPAARYVASTWLPWLLVSSSTVTALALVVARRRPPVPVVGSDVRITWSPVGVLLDLASMFVLASAIRVLLPTGLPVGPGFAGGVGVASLYAAGGNNLPVAAALGASPGLGTWAGVLAAAIGPNLVVTGSVATIICRRIARENGTDLSPMRFSLVGIATVPVQLALAYVGFAIVRAV